MVRRAVDLEFVTNRCAPKIWVSFAEVVLGRCKNLIRIFFDIRYPNSVFDIQYPNSVFRYSLSEPRIWVICVSFAEVVLGRCKNLIKLNKIVVKSRLWND